MDRQDGAAPAEVRVLSVEEQREAARALCLRALARRARSRTELSDLLDQRDVEPVVRDAVLDRFTDVGLIDDPALAAGLVVSAHTGRGLSRRAVGVTLRRRGVAADDAEQALTAITDDGERVRAEELVRARLPALRALAPVVRQRRLVSLLARKGYPPGVCFAVVRAALADSEGVDMDGAGEVD